MGGNKREGEDFLGKLTYYVLFVPSLSRGTQLKERATTIDSGRVAVWFIKQKSVKLFPIPFVLLSDEAQKYRKINPKAPRFRDKCRRREDSACSFVSMQGVPPVLPGNGTNPAGALRAH